MQLKGCCDAAEGMMSGGNRGEGRGRVDRAFARLKWNLRLIKNVDARVERTVTWLCRGPAAS
jgi:hypothetical protein